MSHLLATTCGDKLLDVFTRLSLRTKLRFARPLEVLDDDELVFVEKLADIRNIFAHDVRQAGTTLAVYVSGLDANQLNSLKDAIGPGVDPFLIADKTVPELTFVRENPKLCLWLKALFVISFIYQRKDLTRRKREVAAEREQLAADKLRLEQLIEAVLPPTTPRDLRP